MKNTFTILFILAFSLNTFSQSEIQVTTGASYANEVYYNLEGGVLKTAARTNWDIAFAAGQMSVSILANTGSGLMLYTYPNGTIDDWGSVDTSGIEWNPLYNSIETWENGAFNINTVAGNMFDFGWGIYNMGNHFITGDSLYILTLADGTYKKLAIVEKDAVNNKYTFKYADLDGGNEVTKTFDADDYPTSYIHYSVANGEFVAQEPETRWQLLFTKYFDYNIPYYVTGVLANNGVIIQEVNGVDQSNFKDYNSDLFNDTISQIGSDWKTFNMGTFQYDISDDVVFFVQDTLDGEEDHPVWKIYFTAFSGSTTGVYTFVQEELETKTAGIRPAAHQSNITIYPNPASNQVNIIHDFSGEVEISVYSIDGRVVLSHSVIVSNGLNNQKLDISSLLPGIYNITIRSGSELFTTRFIKE